MWHDFHPRAGYYLLDEIESRWQTPSVEISHPTGSGWLPDLAFALLDGIRHQLDDRDDGTHVLRDPFFRDGGGCELGDPQTLSRALDRIEAEPRTPWRPVTSERFGPEHFGLSSLSDSVALLRVDVASKPT